MLGTGPYMAPEQFRDAKAVDFRADIYSFGVVLFEMIAGNRPFQADTFAKLAKLARAGRAPLDRPVTSPARIRAVAKPVDRIVQRCLAKAPNKRYGSYRELRRALARCLWKVARESIVTPHGAGAGSLGADEQGGVARHARPPRRGAGLLRGVDQDHARLRPELVQPGRRRWARRDIPTRRSSSPTWPCT